MTRTQRERWETKTLEKLRKHLRTNLAILTFTSTQDKDEIESRVMATLQESVENVSDSTVESGLGIPSFESHADSLALHVLEEQEFQRDFDWGFSR